MKIGNKTLQLDTMDLVLERRNGDDIVLKLTALPLGFDNLMEEQIPSPTPPAKGFCRTKGERGKLIKDARTGAPMPKYDYQNKAYKSAERLCTRRQGCLMVYHGLRNDKEVTWDAPLAKLETEEKFVELTDAVYEEMKSAGFSLGDLNRIAGAISEISNLNSEEIESVSESFL